MLKSSKYKRCKLLKRKLGVSPGESFTCYGHTWIMQPNGDSIGEIHVDFHKVETASGRYVVLDEEKIKITATSDLQSEFTMDIGTYYGAGDLDKLRRKIGIQRKELIQSFADTRLNVSLPPTMSKSEMITEIMTMVRHKDKDPDTAPVDAGIER